MQHSSKVILLATATSFLIGCGGGGGSDNPIQQGRFKDANVDGLSYTGGLPIEGARITKDGGRFNYQTGDVLTFSVGDITLGTATGKATITPTDLVAGGHLGTPKVIKISQLLQTLDSDGNPNNGITIVPAVVTALGTNTAAVEAINVALGSATVTTLSTTGGGVLDMIEDIAMATDTDGTYTATTAASATAHVEATLQCAYSGVYQSIPVTLGSGSSASIAKLGLLIPAGTAPKLFVDFDNPETDDSINTATTAINFNSPTLTVSFASGISGNAETYTINADDTLSADIEYGSGDDTGTATVRFTRVGGDQDAQYRFVGSDDHRNLLAVDVASAVSGSHPVTVTYYIPDDADAGVVEEYSSTVMLSSGAGSFDIKTDSGTITATINTTAGTASGSFVEQESGESSQPINYSATGCTLN